MSKSFSNKEDLIKVVKEGMEKGIAVLQHDLQKLRTGRAAPSILEGVKVESYGSMMPLSKVATIAAPEARLLTVNPFDKNMLSPIEKAILVSGLGLSPNNDGKIIRIPIPALSEERRKEIAKQAKKIGEEAKITIRHHRQEANAAAKLSQKEQSWSEDQAKKCNDEVQKLTDSYIKKIDEFCLAKEKEILSM